MARLLQIGNFVIGKGHPTFIIGEIGINHNGDLSIAKKLIDAAVLAGCDAVKFQKRTPDICVPEEQKNLLRETPWGLIKYIDYRYKVEFKEEHYREIDRYCKERGILWFTSCWDIPSVEMMETFDPVCYKVPSALVTDDEYLRHILSKNRPVILSTGMSTMDEIRHAVSCLDKDRLLLAHCTSTYPCKPAELNLRMIETLNRDFSCPIGYSGHEVGLQTTLAAVVLGACFIERHITMDRAMWGGDHAASVEPGGLMRLVRDVRVIEEALGDGKKTVYESELPIMKKLRRVSNSKDE